MCACMCRCVYLCLYSTSGLVSFFFQKCRCIHRYTYPTSCLFVGFFYLKCRCIHRYTYLTSGLIDRFFSFLKCRCIHRYTYTFHSEKCRNIRYTYCFQNLGLLTKTTVDFHPWSSSRIVFTHHTSTAKYLCTNVSTRYEEPS